jgi:hypothetical protein
MNRLNLDGLSIVALAACLFVLAVCLPGVWG